MRVDKQKFTQAQKLDGVCSRSKLPAPEIAEYAGITAGTLSAYRTGKRFPNTQVLKKILDKVGAEWSEVEP
jgi:transcriptional regulator with XRE-family HTH domain